MGQLPFTHQSHYSDQLICTVVDLFYQARMYSMYSIHTLVDLFDCILSLLGSRGTATENQLNARTLRMYKIFTHFNILVKTFS